MIDTIRKSNELLKSQNENYFRSILYQLDNDPRGQSQNLALEIELLNASLHNLILQMRSMQEGIDGAFLLQTKKKIIHDFSHTYRVDFESIHLNDSLLNYGNIHPVVAENQLLLLQFDMLESVAMSINNSSDYSFTPPIFKTDTNQYFMLIPGSSPYKAELATITISEITCDEVKIEKKNYAAFPSGEFIGIEIDLSGIQFHIKSKLTIKWTAGYNFSDVMSKSLFPHEYTFPLPQ